MASQITPVREGTFQVLRPRSQPFSTFFSELHAAVVSGRLSESDAQQQAYEIFCGWVASVASQGKRTIARAHDFQHDVLCRFEDRKLAERYDPFQGGTPRAYVRGIAKLMAKERRYRSFGHVPEDVADGTESRPEHRASTREVSRIVVDELMRYLPAAHQLALIKKYGDVALAREPDLKKRARAYLHRSRGIATLRTRLAERGITEY